MRFLWCLMLRTKLKMSTLFSRSIIFIIDWMVIRVPVRPTPVLYTCTHNIQYRIVNSLVLINHSVQFTGAEIIQAVNGSKILIILLRPKILFHPHPQFEKLEPNFA